MSVIVSHGSSHSVSSGGTDNGRHRRQRRFHVRPVGRDGRYDDGQFGGLLDRRQRRKGERYGSSSVERPSAKIATEIVSAGGTDLGAQLSSGGEQKIFGVTSGATVFGGLIVWYSRWLADY